MIGDGPSQDSGASVLDATSGSGLEVFFSVLKLNEPPVFSHSQVLKRKRK